MKRPAMGLDQRSSAKQTPFPSWRQQESVKLLGEVRGLQICKLPDAIYVQRVGGDLEPDDGRSKIRSRFQDISGAGHPGEIQSGTAEGIDNNAADGRRTID